MTVVVEFNGRRCVHCVLMPSETTLGEIADTTAQYFGQPVFDRKSPYHLRSPKGELLRRDALLSFREQYDRNESGVPSYRLSVQPRKDAHATA